MTSKLTITRERLEALAVEDDLYNYPPTQEELNALARMALAAMDSEPVAEVVSIYGDGETIGEREIRPLIGIQQIPYGTKLYRHAQPAPVVPDSREQFETWAKKQGLISESFGIRSVNEQFVNSCWEAWQESRAAMLQAGNDEIGSWSNGKGTPTVTSITPAAPDKKLTDDVLDEIIAGAKTSMEQYLALSLKAERKVCRQEGPTDDERIMAIEGMIGCLRCGDNGWVVGEMGITRCACGQAGNYPVIPDDARDALTKALAAMEFMGDTLNDLDAVCAEDAEFVAPAFEAVRRVLAAAPQEVKGE